MECNVVRRQDGVADRFPVDQTVCDVIVVVVVRRHGEFHGVGVMMVSTWKNIHCA